MMVYDREFFEEHRAGALRSAEVVIPLLSQLVEPRSVVDFGCGIGTWLLPFQRRGVERIRGLDGPYVDREAYLLGPATFTPVDLQAPLELGEPFDLAICLEVAEHLPKNCARTLIGSLARAAPLVLFSAAVPGQGGVHHVNEQWPSYWRDLFAERAFTRLDAIRPLIWKDKRVQPWYRSNIFLYAHVEALHSTPALSELAARARDESDDLELVQSAVLDQLDSVRGLLRQIPRVLAQEARRRFGPRRGRQ